MAGEDRCEQFLRIVSGDETFTTRVADEIIHNHRDIFDMSPEARVAHHKGIQAEILDRFAGCEKQIFNDPTVKYTFRKHFNGTTGTMSNILTSGYLNLYFTLLNRRDAIEVNALDDLITLFSLASSLTVRDGQFVMDTEEFQSMKLIIERLKAMLPRNQLFTEEWFRSYDDFLRRTHMEALEKYTYYRSDPSHQTVEQALEWKTPRLGKDEQKELAEKYFLRSFSHDLYEYYPPYMNPHYYSGQMTEYLEKLPALQQLFTNPREARQVDFIAPRPPPKKSNAGNKSTKKYRKGGSRRNVKKRGNKSSGRRATLRPLR